MAFSSEAVTTPVAVSATVFASETTTTPVAASAVIYSSEVLSSVLEVRVSGVKGKQIAVGADGVQTSNLVDGIFSATVAGRAKMATGYFDEATFTDKVALNAIVFSRLKLSGETYDFATASALRAAAPVGASDVATKAYVDGLINGLTWQPSVNTMYYVGTRTVAEINALVPAAGWSVIAGSAGTPTAGASDALAIGDLAEFDGTNWRRIVQNVGGFPPSGTRAVVAWPNTATLYAPLVDGTDEGKVAQWAGASLTPTLTTPQDGWAVFVEGAASNPPTGYYENKGFGFAGVVPTGSWVQVAGPLPYGTAVQDVGLVNSPGASADIARVDHVHRLQDTVGRWTRYTVDYTALAAAALTNSITLFNLQAGGVIQGVKIKHSTAFSGGAISAYTVAIGVAGDETRYAPAFDVFQAVSPTTYETTGGLGGESHTGATAILITATGVGDNLDQAAAGSVDVWVLTSTAV